MKLKNNALQILYDTLVNAPITVTVYDIDNAFQKCDDALASPSNTAYWSYWHNKAQLMEEKLERANKEIEKLRREVSTKDKRNNELQKKLLEQAGHTDRDLEKEIDYLRKSRLEWAKRAVDRRKERDDARLECENLKNCLDRVTNHLHDVIKNKLDQERELGELKESLSYGALKKMQDRLDEVTKEREKLEEELKKANEKICELKKRLNQMPVLPNDHYAEGYSDGKEEGEENLWNILQTVMYVKPWDISSFYPDVSCMDDIISWDLEDFLDAYKSWYEEKETDSMRTWLTEFCYERECKGCPLESKEYKCGRGYSFRKTDPSDLRIIPDKDLPRYYEKARGCGRYAFSNDVFEKIKDAENKMNKWLMNMDSWECTLEGTIEINKDLLEKVCGVKPDEEEHKLEYGDAVRLPWRDYDYMYIESTEKGPNVRLFDPKNHAVVVTHISNAKYNGGKIILTSEEDLRKIWKDTK